MSAAFRRDEGSPEASLPERILRPNRSFIKTNGMNDSGSVQLPQNVMSGGAPAPSDHALPFALSPAPHAFQVAATCRGTDPLTMFRNSLNR